MIEPKSPTDIDSYIAGFPEEVQQILQRIRLTIREVAPDAVEAIKYQIPTFTLQGNLISFAAYKKHIGLYPAPAGSEDFQKRLAVFRDAKATVRLPLDQPIPYDLVREMVQFRVQEQLQSVAARGKKR